MSPTGAESRFRAVSALLPPRSATPAIGRGVRLWDGVEGVEERYDIEAVSSPSGVTHLTFTRR